MATVNLAITTSAIKTRPRMSAALRALTEREAEFRTMTRKSQSDMTLTGLCLLPESRTALDESIADSWRRDNGNLKSGRTFDEIIVGSGPHAAIYASVRVAMGFPKPLVIEQSNRPGGTFALTANPAWFLNSANRPGLVGLPGKGQALNYFPGFPVQPADITSVEYPANSDIAITTRLALAKSADVVSNFTVGPDSYPYGSLPYVESTTGVRIYGRRIILATGLGEPKNADIANGSTIQTFPQFIRRFDDVWPLRDLSRVAVIGDGDSARCAVESLLGIGPSGMSLASLDYVSQIDWYGRSLNSDCETFRRSNRTRYARISKYVGTSRLNVIRQRVIPVPAMNSVIVGGQSYDLAILATGQSFVNRPFDDYSFSTYSIGGRNGQELATKFDGKDIYRIGPAANLAFSDMEYESGITGRPENNVALFRYANKTAALASALPAPSRLI